MINKYSWLWEPSICPIFYNLLVSSEIVFFEIRVVVMAKLRKYTCPKCEEGFVYRQHLYRHKLSCILGEKYRCIYCGLEFKRQDTLKKHHSKNRCKHPFCTLCYRLCDGVCDLRKNLSQAGTQASRETGLPSKAEQVEFSEDDAEDDADRALQLDVTKSECLQF